MHGSAAQGYLEGDPGTGSLVHCHLTLALAGIRKAQEFIKTVQRLLHAPFTEGGARVADRWPLGLLEVNLVGFILSDCWSPVGLHFADHFLKSPLESFFERQPYRVDSFLVSFGRYHKGTVITPFLGHTVFPFTGVETRRHAKVRFLFDPN